MFKWLMRLKQSRCRDRQGNSQAENENAGQPASGVEETSNGRVTSADKLNMLQSIEVQLAVEVGRAKMTIKDLLLLNEGSVIELDRCRGSIGDNC